MRALLLSLALAAATPAHAMKVIVEYEGTAEFDDYETFAYKPSPESSLQEHDVFLHRQLLLDIHDRLVARGMRKAEEGEVPDLWVTYHASANTETRVDVRDYGYMYGPSWYRSPFWGPYYGPSVAVGYPYDGWGSETVVYDVTTGQLVVDVIDAEKGQIVFRGAALDVVVNGRDQARKKMLKAVDIMAKKLRKMRQRDAKLEAREAKRAAKRGE